MDEIGVKTIKDYQTIMKWNRVFRTNEIFPHPNYYVEMGKSDQPVFLETFPEVKLELSRWAKLNLSNLSCESIGVQLKQKIIPHTYATYLEDCGLDNQDLSYEDFLKCFKNNDLVCKEVFGDYSLNYFDKQRSPRLILIAQKQ